jgi:hypothetical protein
MSRNSVLPARRDGRPRQFVHLRVAVTPDLHRRAQLFAEQQGITTTAGLRKLLELGLASLERNAE